MLAIRRYADADHSVVFELHNLALHLVGAHVGNGEWDADLHAIPEVYLDAGGEFLVGEVGGRVVAMGALKRVDDDVAEVTRMRVHPDHHRRGFGQAILDHLEARARELGYSTLRLDTTTRQLPAQKLYEKNGFRKVAETTVAQFHVLQYEKRL